MDFGSTLLFVFTIVTAVGILIYMRHVRRRVVNLPRTIDRAVERSAFRPTVFRIYDKSSDAVCDRLIVVEPFDWYVWACRGQLFVLNPEGGSVKCQAGTTPAVRVLERQFYETCVNLDLDTLLRGYTTTGVLKEVPYDIEGTTFTILSALNILCKEWITFEKDDDEAPKIRVRRSAGEREIDGDALLRFMNRPTHKSHSELLRHYELHTATGDDDRFRHVTDRVRLKERISLTSRFDKAGDADDDEDEDETNLPTISSRD